MIATLLAIFAQFCSAVMAERTFIMVKPDGVHRGIVGEIIKRFEQKGFKLVAMKFAMASIATHIFPCRTFSRNPCKIVLIMYKYNCLNCESNIMGNRQNVITSINLSLDTFASIID